MYLTQRRASGTIPYGTIPAVGEDWSVPIADAKRWSVAFLVKEQIGSGGVVHKRPIGTGFFVHMAEELKGTSRPDPKIPTIRHFNSIRYTYLVTAAHIVRHGEPDFVRVHKRVRGPGRAFIFTGGDVVDLPLPDSWVFNPEVGKDVAVIPVNISQDEYYFIPIWGSTDAREDEKLWFSGGRPVALGERVFFIGLLGNVPAMGNANIPMVRTGTLGAIWQDGIPMDFGGTTSLHIKAHLIDCHAYAGFSGSPVFLHREVVSWKSRRRPFQRHVIGGPTVEEWERKEGELTPFLGMIAGHFPYKERVRPETKSGYEEPLLTLPVNAGVGIVIPKEYIWETLALEELVEDRKKRKERAEREIAEHGDAEEHGAGIPDVIRPGPDPERLKIDEDWENAVKRALEQEKPEEGWSDDQD